MSVINQYLFFRFTSALLLFGAFALHSLPASLLFRPFSFYTRGQGQTQIELSAFHKDDLPEAKVTTESGHQVTSDNDLQNMTPGITLTTDEGSKHTLEGKSGTSYSKLEEMEESHVAMKPQELHALEPSDPDEQVTEQSDPNGASDLNGSFMEPSKSVSALNEPKTRVRQLIKAASHSNMNLWSWNGSATSLNNRHSLHMSTASLSIVEFQELPPDVMQLQKKDMVRQTYLILK